MLYGSSLRCVRAACVAQPLPRAADQDHRRLSARRGARRHLAAARRQARRDWGKPVVVENVTGASGNIAVERVAKAAPDGYTLLMGGNALAGDQSQPVRQAALRSGEGLRPITQMFIVPNILVVRPDVPAKTIQELVALAKAQPDYLIAGHAGIGTSQHLAGELFKSWPGARSSRCRTAARPRVLPDLLAGRLNIFFGNITNVLPLIREGKLRALRHHLAQALAANPRAADHGGARLPGLRSHRLVRPDGAGRHAATGHRQAAQGNRAAAGVAGRKGKLEASASSSSAARLRNSRPWSRPSFRMGQGDQGGGIKLSD